MNKTLIPLFFIMILLILTPGASKVLFSAGSPSSLPFLTATDSAQAKSGSQTSSDSTQQTLPSPLAIQQTNPDLQPNRFQKFNYPDAKVISSTNDSLILESSDSPSEITSWYKGQIHSQDMQTTSFIETNTNGEVFNQLVGTNGAEKIAISISTVSPGSLVKMEIKSYD